MGALFALIVIGIGLVWYAGLQPNIPSELSFLKWDHHTAPLSASDTANASSTSVAPLTTLNGSSGWRFLSTPDGFEYSRDFNESIRGGAVPYDSPTFGITCYHNTPYVHVDTRLHARGAKAVEVSFDGNEQPWLRAEGQNLFAPNSAALLRDLSSRQAATMRVAFEEAPSQVFTLKLAGLPKILEVFHRDCGLPR